MRYLPSLFFIFATLASGYLTAQVAAVATPLPADVRVLIDVSGSMKKTDPQNLRQPAMELLVQLLPDSSKAGVWTFGQSVNLLVAHRPVDSDWRQDAAAKTTGISSVAMFTNIGKALEQATYDSDTLKDDYRHNIILLTDGVVDINTDASINTKERQRILNEILPQLKKAGYIVHTIALSAAADQELMQKLSLATDGVFAVAVTADELMSTFLRIFDQAVPAERLPLEDNTFLVDESVEEFTALIFRKQGAASTVFVSPAGAEFTGPNVEEGINWYKTERYDLVTVTKPATGQWRVKADFDTDNRVTVVSDLQFQMSPLTNNLHVGQALDLHFSFHEESATVTDVEFLRLLEMNALVTRSHDSKNWQIPLSESHPPVDGTYQQSLELFREKGHYAIRILIDGKTFKREYKHNLTVISPFTLEMNKSIEEERVVYRFKVTADQQLIDVSKTTIAATIKDSTGASEVRELILNEQKEWHLTLRPTVAARYSVNVDVTGMRANGSEFNESLNTHYFQYPEQNDPIAASPEPVSMVESGLVEEPVVAEEIAVAEEIVEDEPVAEEKPVEQKAHAAIESPPKEINQWLLYAGISLANLLVLGFAFFAYRLITGKKAKDELTELEQTLATETPVAAPAVSKPTMQEVEDKPTRIIDVSDENLSENIDIPENKNPGTSDDDLFVDLDDLENSDDMPEKDK